MRKKVKTDVECSELKKKNDKFAVPLPCHVLLATKARLGCSNRQSQILSH